MTTDQQKTTARRPDERADMTAADCLREGLAPDGAMPEGLNIEWLLDRIGEPEART